LWFCFCWGWGGVWCVRFGSDRPARDLQCKQERRHRTEESACGLGFLNFLFHKRCLILAQHFPFFFHWIHSNNPVNHEPTVMWKWSPPALSLSLLVSLGQKCHISFYYSWIFGQILGRNFLNPWLGAVKRRENEKMIEI